MKTRTVCLEAFDTVTEEIGEAVVIRLLGHATIGNLDYLERQLRGVMTSRPTKIVIVGDELAFISAAAVGMLVRFQRDAVRWGGEVRLAGLPL